MNVYIYGGFLNDMRGRGLVNEGPNADLPPMMR